MGMILFLVTQGSRHVVTPATGREHAKRQAHPTLLHNPDNYVVTPLTREEDDVYFNLGHVRVV